MGLGDGSDSAGRVSSLAERVAGAGYPGGGTVYGGRKSAYEARAMVLRDLPMRNHGGLAGGADSADEARVRRSPCSQSRLQEFLPFVAADLWSPREDGSRASLFWLHVYPLADVLVQDRQLLLSDIRDRCLPEHAGAPQVESSRRSCRGTDGPH